VSTRIRFVQPVAPVRRGLSVVGAARLSVDVLAAWLVFARARLRAQALTRDRLAERTLAAGLFAAPLAAGAALGYPLAAAALGLAAAAALAFARAFPAHARAIEATLSIALGLIVLALAGVAAHALLR
jgi:hypothetical protein